MARAKMLKRKVFLFLILLVFTGGNEENRGLGVGSGFHLECFGFPLDQDGLDGCDFLGFGIWDLGFGADGASALLWGDLHALGEVGDAFGDDGLAGFEAGGDTNEAFAGEVADGDGLLSDGADRGGGVVNEPKVVVAVG